MKEKKKSCELHVKLPEYGDWSAKVIKGHEAGCTTTLKKMNPVRGTYWKRHIKE
jgi:hypothetical protein